MVLRRQASQRTCRRPRSPPWGSPSCLRDEWREWRLEQEANCQRIDHLDLVDLRQLGFPERARLHHMSVKREFRCRRVERLAIVKFDARSQLYSDGLAVGGGLVGEGELRYELQVFIDVKQLVAQTGEDDAADVGSGCRGIKVVGIFG